MGIVLLVFARYFAYTLSPFDLEAIQEISDARKIAPGDWKELDSEISNLVERGLILEYLSENAYVGTSLFLSGVFFIFTALHLFIDKLFFKFFYEKASITLAFRRAFILCIGIFFIFYFRLKSMPSEYLLLIPVMCILLEYALSKYIIPELILRIENYKNNKTFSLKKTIGGES